MKVKGIYLALAWILTVAAAYLVGWLGGVRSVTHVASHAAHSGLSIAIGVLAFVAVISGISAFRVRGYFDHRHTVPPTH